MRDPAFACKLEYLRGVARGQSTSAKLEVPSELLTAGCRIWVRSGRSQPFRRVRERISVLDFTWESDLHPMELRCSLPELGQVRSARALLKRSALLLAVGSSRHRSTRVRGSNVRRTE